MASGQDSRELVRDIRERVAADIPWIRSQLERLIRIPSVSAEGFDPAHVRSSANATAEILSEAGLGDARLLEIDGAHPAVFGELPGPPGSPTVLLYAHHDVQPPGEESLWISPPFEPTERGGRLYGRGASDDKGGIAVHAAAIRAHEGSPPVGVKVVVEGEEEASSEHLPEFLTAYGRDLAADVLVLADSSNWRIGVPALTTSIRGVLDCVVEVRTLDHAVGSPGGRDPRKHGRAVHRRRGRSVVRRRSPSVPRRLGPRPRRHRDGGKHPAGEGVRRRLPGGNDPAHRHRGSRRARARREREPASRRVRAGVRGRSPAPLLRRRLSRALLTGPWSSPWPRPSSWSASGKWQ